jgi:transposase
LEIPNDIVILKDLVVRLLSRIEDLEAENTALKSVNADLLLRLSQNSNNSHKPPSTDGLSKKPALPQSQGKKTGGQFGHKGKTLLMVSQPDQLIIHHAPFCSCCSKVFSLSDVEQIVAKRQVFDIPPPRLEVTEHQIGLITCCQQEHKGTFPSSVSQPVQYGTKIKALSVLLNTDYKIPFEKIEQLLGDLYDCSFNESTAISANLTCFDALETIESSIKSEILQSQSVHFDETGMRVEGKLHWFHTASTTLFTYLFVHAKRGKEALNSSYSLIKDFKNWAIHDCWASYFDFKNCSHALCNAHILRELESLKECGSKWAIEMQKLLLELFDLSQKATLIVPDKDIWIQKYLQICQNADKEEPPPIYGKRGNRNGGRPKNTKGRNLLNRLKERQNGVLAFAFVQHIPFTNNQAERDIRCLKTKQKVATSFRTFNGAKTYARIQSFVSTLRKHDMNVFQNLIIVLNQKQVVFTDA